MFALQGRLEITITLQEDITQTEVTDRQLLVEQEVIEITEVTLLTEAVQRQELIQPLREVALLHEQEAIHQVEVIQEVTLLQQEVEVFRAEQTQEVQTEVLLAEVILALEDNNRILGIKKLNRNEKNFNNDVFGYSGRYIFLSNNLIKL